MSIFICPFCHQDTAGNHAWDCPLNPNVVHKNKDNNSNSNSKFNIKYGWSSGSITEED